MIYIPNLLTLTRIGLVPFLIVLLQSHQYFWSLLVFLLAGLTDSLDGYLARRFNAQTKLGALLDPIADKSLLVATYVMLSVASVIPFWLMVVVVFRDIVIVCGYLLIVVFFRKVDVKPLLVSKVNTLVQITFIVVLLSSLTWSFEIDLFLSILSYIVLLTSIVSGMAYVLIGSIKATNEAQQ